MPTDSPAGRGTCNVHNRSSNALAARRLPAIASRTCQTTVRRTAASARRSPSPPADAVLGGQCALMSETHPSQPSSVRRWPPRGPTLYRESKNCQGSPVRRQAHCPAARLHGNHLLGTWSTRNRCLLEQCRTISRPLQSVSEMSGTMSPASGGRVREITSANPYRSFRHGSERCRIRRKWRPNSAVLQGHGRPRPQDCTESATSLVGPHVARAIQWIKSMHIWYYRFNASMSRQVEVRPWWVTGMTGRTRSVAA